MTKSQAQCSEASASELPTTHVVTIKASMSAAQVESRFLECMAHHPRYELEGKIATGGMGVIYRAKHRLMGRTVALKVLHPKWLEEPITVERFRREVTAAAQIHHPNIVTAFDADHVEGIHFLVMEYVEGESLAERINREGPLSCSVACDYIRQAALGLQAAHQRQMVHRDIKPHNLMLTRDGVVKILDFGIARLLAEKEAVTVPASSAPSYMTNSHVELTMDNGLLGTVDYVAPEQIIDARKADIRADIYGLGCTLYHLLAGKTLFADRPARDKIRAHKESEPVPISKLVPGVPSGLEAVIMKMLAKDLASRYQTPAEVARALQPFCPGSKPMTATRWFEASALAACFCVLFVAWLGYPDYWMGTSDIEGPVSNGQSHEKPDEKPNGQSLDQPQPRSVTTLTEAQMTAKLTPAPDPFMRVKNAYVTVSPAEKQVKQDPPVTPGSFAVGTAVGAEKQAKQELQERPVTSGGVIVSPDGLIITTLHGLEKSPSVVVVLEGGTEVAGAVIRTDPVNDLALVKIDVKTEQQFLSPHVRKIINRNESVHMWQRIISSNAHSIGTVTDFNCEYWRRDGFRQRGLIQLQMSMEAWDVMHGVVVDNRNQLVGLMVGQRSGEQIFYALSASTLARFLDGAQKK